MTDINVNRSVVDLSGLPPKYPTHMHDSSFWESLGRAVATFGFLEEVLGKAIFAFTATRPYEESEVEQAYAEWLPTLERALFDPLGNLINAYGKAVNNHPGATITHLNDLLDALRKASAMRNILCHGSWRPPDSSGASVPLFVNPQKMVVDSSLDVRLLDQVQRHTAQLACRVISTVTQMGWQFPGGAGPGKPIWTPKHSSP
jgi:hypothetical protein